MEKKLYFYRLAQFQNYHEAVFASVETNEVRSFVISNIINSLEDYIEFLEKEVKGLIGFNNLEYDYPMLHFILEAKESLKMLGSKEMLQTLYAKSCDIMREEYSAIKKPIIPQLDLYKIWHFDKKEDPMFLKAIAIALEVPGVLEMPYRSDAYITGSNPEGDIANSFISDLMTIQELHKRSKDKIDFRRHFTEKLGFNVMNQSNPRLGESIFLHLLSKEMGMSKWDIRKLRTDRASISLRDIILPYIDFRTTNFTTLKSGLEEKQVRETKGSINEKVFYKNVVMQYGLGGVHACCESGIYESDSNYMIIDIDAKSFYSRISIVNEFFPEHLGGAFCKVYKELYDARMDLEEDDPFDETYKKILTMVFGKSNEVNSFFYDPKFMMSNTINGQLLLTMLVESICESLDAFIIQVNTDGAIFRIKREDYETFKSVCTEWEHLTKISLKYAEYQKMVIKDVSNYSAQTMSNIIKHRGIFEIDKSLDKDHSMKVVRIALEKYYFEGVPIAETIVDHGSIYDFCKRYRAAPGWSAVYEGIKDGKIVFHSLPRYNRYFVSNDGQSSLLKVHSDKRKVQIEYGRSLTIFNEYYYSEDYGIDYSYYIKEANKIINSVDDGQKKLF